jgi:transposase
MALHRQGYGFHEIADMLGMGHITVRSAVKACEGAAPSILKLRTPGRKPGSARMLSAEQEQRIQKLICEKRPEQMKMSFALWSRAAVLLLIEQECGIKLAVRSVGHYLKRWGFTPQRPIKRAYEQSPEAVKTWLDEQYPQIAQRAKAENAEIHWADETAVVNTDVRGRGFAPKGQTPVAYAVGGTRHKLSMISSVTNQGKARWMIVEDAFDSDKFIEFLQLLVKDADKKIFIVLDNLRVHHSKPVKAWLQQHQQQIEAFYLPSYSPELNPDERLNADLKHALGSRVQVRTKAKLRETTEEHMQLLQSQPQRVQSYFEDPRVKYASANLAST